jgi:hypothetical protein
MPRALERAESLESRPILPQRDIFLGLFGLRRDEISGSPAQKISSAG